MTTQVGHDGPERQKVHDRGLEQDADDRGDHHQSEKSHDEARHGWGVGRAGGVARWRGVGVGVTAGSESGSAAPASASRALAPARRSLRSLEAAATSARALPRASRSRPPAPRPRPGRGPTSLRVTALTRPMRIPLGKIAVEPGRHDDVVDVDVVAALDVLHRAAAVERCLRRGRARGCAAPARRLRCCDRTAAARASACGLVWAMRPTTPSAHTTAMPACDAVALAPVQNEALEDSRGVLADDPRRHHLRRDVGAETSSSRRQPLILELDLRVVLALGSSRRRSRSRSSRFSFSAPTRLT